MKSRLTLLLPAICLFCTGLLPAAEPADRLAEGLLAEEVRRDPEAAAVAYEQVLEGFDEHQAIAATALFRLAEVRRKQDRKDDAIALYQRLLREFPAAEAETKLARENLAALGASIEPAKTEIDPSSPEAEELFALAELRELMRTSPDVALELRRFQGHVSDGHTQVVRFLLENGVDAPPGLEVAAEQGNLEMVQLLLAHCGDDDIEEKTTALWYAAEAGYAAIVRTLLEAGADPNQTSSYGVGDSLLTKAVGRGYSMEVLNLLLDAKADPRSANLLGFTPLHMLVFRGCDDAERIKLAGKLLEAGADIQALTYWMLPEANRSDRDYEEILRKRKEHDARSTLALAIEMGQFDFARYLVSKGADVRDPLLWHAVFARFNQTPQLSTEELLLKQIRLLLDLGADPNAAIGSPSPQPGGPFFDKDVELNFPDSPLSLAYQSTAAMKLLLENGAKPGEHLGKILLRVGVGDADASMTLALLGDSPPPLRNPLGDHVLRTFTPAVREVYLERLFIPYQNRRERIAWFDRDSGLWKELNAMVPKDGESMEAVLSGLLKEITYGMDLPTNSEVRRWPELMLHTPDDPAGVAVDPTGDGPLPRVMPGSVISIRTSKTRSPDSALFQWHLTRRKSLDIDFTLDGKTRKLTLRDGRISFDITGDDVPLLPARDLAYLLGKGLDPAGWPDDLSDAEIEIRRRDWAPVRLWLGDPAAASFQLQQGDRLEIIRAKGKSWKAALDEAREAGEPMTRVAVAIPGFPFLWTHDGEAVSQDSSKIAVLPSLVQVLAEIQSAETEIAHEVKRREIKDADSLVAAFFTRQREIGTSSFPVVLRRLDLSRIRIRRFDRDGGESMVDVDLQKAIDACTVATSAEEARKFDVALQPGDIVLLRVAEDDAAEPWEGMDEAQSRFFMKVLNGGILVHGGQDLAQLAIDYHPAIWRNTRGGWLALPPDEGTSSLCLAGVLPRSIIGGPIGLERDGRRYSIQVGKDLFPKDGDKVGNAYSPHGSSIGPGIQRMPPLIPPPPVPGP